MKKIIGIHGLINSGKDTISFELSKVLKRDGLNVELLTFATNLKKAISILFCIPLEDLYDRDCKNNMYINLLTFEYKHINDLYHSEVFDGNVSCIDPRENTFIQLRKFLQWFGTDVCRNKINDNIHINNTLKVYDENDSDTIYIVTDVRFINEAMSIINRGGIVFNIIRDVVQYDHISETELSNFQDMVDIDNNGNIDKTIDTIYKFLKSNILDADKGRACKNKAK